MSVEPITAVAAPERAAAVQASTSAVAGAIRKAAQTTGASFDYLLATAKVESSLNPTLKTKTSSATGLFQFIDQTWLATMKQAGGSNGYARYADAIQKTSSGRYVVADPVLRSEIMNLRKDPTANAVMAGAFTRQNAAILANRLGRAPSEGELYIAHFFGAGGAAKIIKSAGNNPQADASTLFPQAARANRPIFYDKAGSARSVAGVYNELVRRYQVARASPMPGEPAAAVANVAQPAAATQPAAAMQPVRDTAGVTAAFAVASAQGANAAQQPAPVFYSMFRSEDRRGPVAALVTELWSPHAAKSRADAAEAAFGAAAAPPAAPAPADGAQTLRPNLRSLFTGGA